jgi:glycosyltransferase involved in cell wall biosynthesis/lipopolysaccharide biosynthesis glycosyltransferase
MDVVTICAANYLPFAEVLGNSFLEHNPDSIFSILVVDAKKVTYTKNEKFKYLTPVDLEIPVNVFENMAFYYNVTELATALKPSALKALFKSGSTKVAYLDPDIQVFGELAELKNALNESSIVLTPHTLTPIPRDRLRPSEADIMGSGTFNLGFIALSKSDVAFELLDWWEERLRFDSISDPEEMLFTDQRWIDLVPSYFPIHVLRDSSYNVAYWNLQERKLSKNGETFTVNNKELQFFHFSGYRPDKPWILSKYVADNPRIVLSGDDVLIELCENYSKLAFISGWLSESAISYGYQNFESGELIPSSLRRLYREDCIAAYKQGEVLLPPKDWQEWATKRTVQSGNLSRILFSIWKTRPDLKRRYPDATGTEAQDLLQWASTHGVYEKVISDKLLTVGDLTADSYPNVKSKKIGINIAGYLQGELGLGQSARLIQKSAINTGLPTTNLNSNRSLSRQGELLTSTGSQVIYPLTIAIVNADHFKFWIDDIDPKRISHSTIIGVWAWEIEDFPEVMHTAFDLVDEVWAVSQFVKDAISKHSKKKVLVFPTPIIAPDLNETLDRSAIGLPAGVDFNLFIFDYMSIFHRKNPLAIVEAHKKAFPNSDGPILVIKSANGDSDAQNREKLRFSIKGRKDIFLVEEYLSRNQLNALVAECQSYISLHRSEGYGLTMAEAMALGKPVIATAYSGNLDFMNNENSILIPYSLVSVGPDAFPYPETSKWAEPDIDKAADAIRKLALDSDYRQNLGAAAKKYVEQEFSIENASSFIRRRANYHFSIVGKLDRSLKQIMSSIKKFIKILRAILRSPKKIKKIL